MRFSTLFALVSSIGFVAATPVAEHTVEARDATSLKRSGCGSTGPFGTGHFEWFITASCTSGASMTCQATDASGCEPGVVKKIGSMEVDNPDDTQQIAKKSNTNSVSFICPAGGQVRCQANFNDNNDGPNYSLRVF